ncbi:unnamed protein product [Diabrotica balteata]|uniref:BESS domain-containing protein n=1 Tax=Diabrotica balteata TaxID=107213 RepID=A0A9N9SMT5_DIABA|nr:unnamed protein product [Diabrotica balteata]
MEMGHQENGQTEEQVESEIEYNEHYETIFNKVKVEIKEEQTEVDVNNLPKSSSSNEIKQEPNYEFIKCETVNSEDVTTEDVTESQNIEKERRNPEDRRHFLHKKREQEITEFLDNDLIDSFESFLRVLDNNIPLKNWTSKIKSDCVYFYVLNINQLGHKCDNICVISSVIVSSNFSVGNPVIVNVEDKLRKKGKYLRDQFSTELSKTKRPTSEDEGEEKHITSIPQNTSSNTPPTATTSQTRKFQPMSKRIVKRQRTNDYTASMLEIDRKKLEILARKTDNKNIEESEDEDLHFFKSILPHVKKIMPERILEFCGRIQQLVQEFAYPSNLLRIQPLLPVQSPFAPRSHASTTHSIPSEQDSQFYISRYGFIENSDQ